MGFRNSSSEMETLGTERSKPALGAVLMRKAGAGAGRAVFRSNFRLLQCEWTSEGMGSPLGLGSQQTTPYVMRSRVEPTNRETRLLIEVQTSAHSFLPASWVSQLVILTRSFTQ